MKSRDTPLAEITLRKYERPFNIKGRDLVSKLCLSVGLLQPGDSRDIVVDVFMALLNNHKKNKNREMSSKEIEESVISLRKKSKLKLHGIASSNIRRQIKRLRDLYLVEKVANNYRITENEKLSNIYKDKIEQFLLTSIKERVSEYFGIVDNEFKKELGQKIKSENQQKKVNSVKKETTANKAGGNKPVSKVDDETPDEGVSNSAEKVVPKDQLTFDKF